MAQFLRYLKHRKNIVCVLLLTFILLYLYSGLNIQSPTNIDINVEEPLLNKLNTNLIINEVSVIRCLRYNCPPPDEYVKLYPSINLYSSSFDLFNYFVIVKKVQNDNPMIDYLQDVRIQPEKPSDEYILEQKYSIKLWKKFERNSDQDKSVVSIRDINLLYGTSDLLDSRYYWEYQHDPVPYFHSRIPIHLSLLKMSKLDEIELIPKLKKFQDSKSNNLILTNADKFRVLQLSDLHFGQDRGICYDKNECKSDLKTLNFIRESIEKEKIDFVVITGDLIDFHRVQDVKSVLIKGLQPILEKNIPFIFTFGESDSNELRNQYFSNEKLKILSFLSSLDNCYNYLPSSNNHNNNIHGLTNYNLNLFKIKNGDDDANAYKYLSPNAMITVFDSQDHMIHSSQINFLYRLNQNYKKSNIFKLLFFHYPLPNFRPIGKFKIIGSYNEKHPLNSKTNSKFRDDIINCGYNMISVGHEHHNDACIVSENEEDNKNIWLCYNGVTGDSGETSSFQDFDRRLRIFEIDLVGLKLLSWKRSEKNGKGFDYQLVEEY